MTIEKFHPEVIADDLPFIFTELGSLDAYREFTECMQHAIKTLKRNPFANSRPLSGVTMGNYRRHPFHSVKRPPRGAHADMRLVYRHDDVNDILYIYGVGFRFDNDPPDPRDVYQRLAGRPTI